MLGHVMHLLATLARPPSTIHTARIPILEQHTLQNLRCQLSCIITHHIIGFVYSLYYIHTLDTPPKLINITINPTEPTDLLTHLKRSRPADEISSS